MSFTSEYEFETALIAMLGQYGWEKEVIVSPSEEDLIQNWADILFANNREIDRLNGVPLTGGEMAQIIEQINQLKTPLRLNEFINGKSVAIKRDNPADTLHFGKEVSLKIYDRREIAAGSSRYQIVRQPKFKTSSEIFPNRRGDVMLLINGMPVIHIELKKSGVPISQATNQIEKYLRRGVFGGLFSLVQIFVAMTPDETLYFANNLQNGKLNNNYFFHWADFNNEPVNDWKNVVEKLLSIPMAHQLIGFYTVADGGDGCLKVMRSYQYFAANQIASQIAKTDWKNVNQRGGYIWHTTGSGKTVSSFKAAQLMADSGDVDKVVFLLDRIELGVQSLSEYQNFAEDKDDVQGTENTDILLTKLKSDNAKDSLIVTSIQKMSNLAKDNALKQADMDKINAKRMAFIVDECHRTTFGEMMNDIKRQFANAVFFGFTGTPIMAENERKHSTSSDIFGDELHRYSLADGIRDGNVLGFDVYQVATFKDSDLRRVIGLEKAKADSVADAMADEAKKKIYLKYQDAKQVPMAGFVDKKGKYIKGIEDEIPSGQFNSDNHRRAVVNDIADKWMTLSQGGKFHAMLATSSIPEAINYYRLIKQMLPELKITALFDPNEGNSDGYALKEDGIEEILTDYNAHYGKNYTIATYANFKKDVASRLAHKDAYKSLDYTKEPEQILDLLIVVDQMLTGFDSKWVNTLYVDKLMTYEYIIQAFSRTNRLFGYDKQFGTIRYYRYVHTMNRNIDNAVALFSGNKPFDLFVNKLPQNIYKINQLFDEIKELFQSENMADFSRLPENNAVKAKFAQLFCKLTLRIEAAKIQGFTWTKSVYEYEEDGENKAIECTLDEQTFLTLLLRYKELSDGNGGGTGGGDDTPFDIDTHITEMGTERIDSDFMNNRFEKYLRALQNHENTHDLLTQLHHSFASLTQDEQKYANLFLTDVQNGTAHLQADKTLRDYITEYQARGENQAVIDFAEQFGLDLAKLKAMLQDKLTEANLNEHNRFDELRKTANEQKVQAYFNVPMPIAKAKFSGVLKEFLLEWS